MNSPLIRKPSTYLTASLVMGGFFIWLPIFNLPFLAAASLSTAINMAYYSGDIETARRLSARARLWLILGSIVPGMLLVGIPTGVLLSLMK